MLATVLDPQAGNAKNRPCVVMEVLDESCLLIAITTSFDASSLSSTQLVVPHRSSNSQMSKIQTGITKPSVVDVRWSATIKNELCKKVGKLPEKLFAAVKQLLVDHSRNIP